MTILEGTWEEVSRYAPELAGRRVRLTVLEEAPTSPNQGMLEALRLIAEYQKDQQASSGERTQEFIRAARNGGMYGLNSTE